MDTTVRKTFNHSRIEKCNFCGTPHMPKYKRVRGRLAKDIRYYCYCPNKPSFRTYDNYSITGAIRCWNFLVSDFEKWNQLGRLMNTLGDFKACKRLPKLMSKLKDTSQ